MVCDICKERDAVVQLTQVVENAVTQLHLCERCAAERGVETTVAMPKHPLGDFLQALQQQGTPGSRTDALRRDFCGSTMKDFRQSGRLGCARCYAAFEASLRELLRRVHGASRHSGQRYEPPATAEMQRKSELDTLRDRLRRAVELEQFETAAQLRDKIRVLE